MTLNLETADVRALAEALKRECEKPGVYGRCDSMHVCDDCEHNKKRCPFFTVGAFAAGLKAAVKEANRSLSLADAEGVTERRQAMVARNIIRAIARAYLAAGGTLTAPGEGT